MPLQSSGQIAISQIRTELGTSSGSLRGLSALAGKSSPDAMSEFYGYSNLPAPLYTFGSPQLLFDFAQTAGYSNSGTQINDLSGNGNHGVFSVGTGNGTPSTVTGYFVNGYLNLPGTSAQRSVRLPDAIKPNGTNPFSIVVWMRLKGYSYNGGTPGIVSHGDNASGLSWYVNSADGSQNVWRDINCGSNGFVNQPYQSGGGLNVWQMYAVTSSGTNQILYQYRNGSLLASSTVATTCGITTQSSWGFFVGLRYNQWINADFSWVAVYNSQLSSGDLSSIGSNLNSRTPT